jgi:hypothetical protein
MNPKETISKLLKDGAKESSVRNVLALLLGLTLIIGLIIIIPLIPAYSYYLISGKNLDSLLDPFTFRNWIGGILLVVFISLINKRNQDLKGTEKN